MNDPRITIYIPCHNYGRFLEQSVESVMRQSVHDWELLLVDDGSTDNTAQIVEYYRTDPRVRCYHTEGIGLIGVANLALSEARGQYIMRLDADDYVDEHILLVLGNYLDSHHEIALVFPDYYLVDEKGGFLSLERRERIAESNYMLDMPSNGACTLVRTKVLNDLGGYRSDIDAQDGFDLWVKIIRNSRCANVNLPLFYYRRHGKNLTEASLRIFNARRRIKRLTLEAEFSGFRPFIACILCRKHYDFEPDVWNAGLNGKTLLQGSLEVCTASSLFDDIVVASDTEDVRDTMSQYDDPRLHFFRRGSEETIRSCPAAVTLDRVAEELDRQRNGVTVLAYNQAPFKTTAGLEEAVCTTLLNRADSAIAVKEVSQQVFQRTPHGMRAVNPPSNVNSDFNSLYVETRTTMAAMNRNFQRGTLTGASIVNFVVPEDEAFFVDSKRSLHIARVIAAMNQSSDKESFDILSTVVDLPLGPARLKPVVES